MTELSHTDSSGKAKMVDVSGKESNLRTASARCVVFLNESAFSAVKNNQNAKGDVLSVAKIGGILAAKRTSELIPLCHNIFISYMNINFLLHEKDKSIEIISSAKTDSQTGIEMEALTAASVAGLIIYDMCKAIDKSIRITNIELISKTGGKSGDYIKAGK